MKRLVLVTSLFASLAVSAGELKVNDVPSTKMPYGHVNTQFEVNLQEGTAGVSATFKKVRPRKYSRIQVTSFEAIVPELSMVGNDLILDVDGSSITCGTMGVTNVFKLPALKLNGNCLLESKRVKTAKGKRFQVVVKY
ncbi:MAG: hypothetical protein NDI69_11610 [Bacteriovoracaceae bacterium]|nr:hypothetical protein [Bacteriovoracaceae bacterium]